MTSKTTPVKVAMIVAESHPGNWPIGARMMLPRALATTLSKTMSCIRRSVTRCIPGLGAGPIPCFPASSVLSRWISLLDAVGDEFLDAAVAGGLRRALRPVEQAVIDLDLGHGHFLRRADLELNGEDVPAHHLRRGGKTELGEDRRREVDERGASRRDDAVAEKHAGHLQRVGAVVGAPGRVVVEQDFLGQVAQTGGPRGAVAAGIADDQVGGQRRRVALVDPVGAVNARGSRACRRRR